MVVASKVDKAVASNAHVLSTINIAIRKHLVWQATKIFFDSYT